MRALLDINVLIALFDPDHVHHERAHNWLEKHGASGIATCPLSENGLVRILSHSAYSKKHRFHPDDLISRLQNFVSSWNHEFWPDSLSIRDNAHFIGEHILGSKQITDLYLLALATSRGGKLLTFDAGVSTAAVLSSSTKNLETI